MATKAKMQLVLLQEEELVLAAKLLRKIQLLCRKDRNVPGELVQQTLQACLAALHAVKPGLPIFVIQTAKLVEQAEREACADAGGGA